MRFTSQPLQPTQGKCLHKDFSTPTHVFSRVGGLRKDLHVLLKDNSEIGSQSLDPNLNKKGESNNGLYKLKHLQEMSPDSAPMSSFSFHECFSSSPSSHDQLPMHMMFLD